MKNWSEEGAGDEDEKKNGHGGRMRGYEKKEERSGAYRKASGKDVGKKIREGIVGFILHRS